MKRYAHQRLFAALYCEPSELIRKAAFGMMPAVAQVPSAAFPPECSHKKLLSDIESLFYARRHLKQTAVCMQAGMSIP